MPLPESERKICQQIEVGQGETFTVSACKSETIIDLYVVSWVGHKPFALLPFPTEARSVVKIQTEYELVMLVDVDPDPYHKSYEGGIFLYELNSDP